jgi:hypothetical protein
MLSFTSRYFYMSCFLSKQLMCVHSCYNVHKKLLYIIRNYIYQNHITLQLKLKKNSYTTIMQLSFGYYNYCTCNYPLRNMVY